MKLNTESTNIQGFEFSENQKNYWQLENESREGLYNQIILEFHESLSSAKLQEAILAVIQTHQVLSFKTHQNKNFHYPIQFADKAAKLDFIALECEKQKLSVVIENQLNKPFDPAKNEPIRFCSIGKAGEVKYLGIRLYTLWGDAFSLLFFCNELSNAFTGLNVYKAQKTEQVDFVNFCAWQNEMIQEPEVAASHFFNTYQIQAPSVVIPYTKVATLPFNPAKKILDTITGNKLDRLKTYCNKENVNIADLLLFQFAAFLSLFSSNELTIGYIPFKRNYEDLDHTLGLVNKVIPVKFNGSESAAKKEGIALLRKNIEQIEAWSDYFSFDRENNQHQTATYLNYCFEYINVSQCQNDNQKDLFRIKDHYNVLDLFDLKISCVDYGYKICIELYYDLSKFGHDELLVLESQLSDYFSKLTENEVLASECSPLENDIIAITNNTDKTFSEQHSIINLFERQVEKNPENIALLTDGRTISFKQLDERSNQLAHYLLEEYQLNNEPVCILLERSEWFIISVLAVLKTGAYYIPIDQNYPEERIHFILKDSRARVLISHKKLVENFKFENVEILFPTLKLIGGRKIENPAISCQAGDIAYCIYTSGSTGNPKGCLITHKNLLNYIQWANEYYFGNNDLGDWALITSVSFDLTVTALFTSLTRGRKIWIGNEEKGINTLLEEAFNCPDVNVLKLTPSHISLLGELPIKNTNVGLIISGGEQLTSKHIDLIKGIKKEIEIYNEYGPTEATVGCIVQKVELDDSCILIGKPIANTSIHIQDTQGQACRVGATGEILIAGSSLSNGYLNRESLTKEKFIGKAESDAKRYYKTGDLGRWFPDGSIQYIGRIDDQVKLNGYRIEMGEIENKLYEKGGIDHCVALVKETDSGKQLVVYLAGKERQNVIELRNYLGKLLPTYMIPNYFIWLEKIPQTANGKADKKYLESLPIKTNATGVEYKAPGNDVEIKLVAIWEEILVRDKVGVLDDFFLSGGNSLRAIRLVNAINKEFGLKYDLRGIYTESTIELIAEKIAIDNRFKDSKALNSNHYSEIKI